MKNSRLHQIIIILLVALCYGNTLTLNYALDDRMVVMESKYTIQGGWEGIKSIFTEDTFNGYFANKEAVVEGGRYRPMSQLSFLLEMEIFGQDIKRKIGDVNDFFNLHNPDDIASFHHPLFRSPLSGDLQGVVYAVQPI